MKELKELVYFGLKCGELFEKLSDGFQLRDLQSVIAASVAAPSAIKDAKLAFDEYVAMSDAEAAELEQYIKENFNISDDLIEGVIYQVLDVLIELRSLASLLKK